MGRELEPECRKYITLLAPCTPELIEGTQFLWLLASTYLLEEYIEISTTLCIFCFYLIQPKLFRDGEQFLEVDWLFEAFEADLSVGGDEPYWRFIRLGTAVATSQDPVQHPDVLAEAGPEEAAAAIGRRPLAEPVDDENAGQVVLFAVEAEPVRQVVAKVVPKERTHRKRIVHYHLLLRAAEETYIFSLF